MTIFSHHVFKGWTLAELLIALAILGVMATFTIPKVLNFFQEKKQIAILKEDVSILESVLYTAYQNGDFGYPLTGNDPPKLSKYFGSFKTTGGSTTYYFHNGSAFAVNVNASNRFDIWISTDSSFSWNLGSTDWYLWYPITSGVCVAAFRLNTCSDLDAILGYPESSKYQAIFQ